MKEFRNTKIHKQISKKEPSLSTRMYNWVKEKLSNLGQSKETIQERKYWKQQQINMKKHTMNKRKH